MGQLFFLNDRVGQIYTNNSDFSLSNVLNLEPNSLQNRTKNYFGKGHIPGAELGADQQFSGGG